MKLPGQHGFQPPSSRNIEIPFSGPVVAYIKSLIQQTTIPAAAGGVTSITDSSTATGALTFTGSGVSQSGTTFTFAGGGGITYGTAFPGSPSTGQQFFRTDLSVLFQYNGTAWEVSTTVESGSSFPSSPAPIQGQLFFRTDTGISYIYLGTTWTPFAAGNLALFDYNIENAVWAPAPTNYYPMDEASGTTVTDAMGVNNGTYHGPPNFQQRVMPPRDGNLVPFFTAGNTCYAVLHDPTTTATDFTVMFGFAINASQIGTGVIVGNYAGDGSHYFNLSTNVSNLLNVGINGSSTNFNYLTPGPFHLGFIVYQQSTTTYRYYIDAGLQNQSVSTYTKQTLGITVGAQDTGLNPWSGFIGKVGIWGSTALTQAQVVAITQGFGI